MAITGLDLGAVLESDEQAVAGEPFRLADHAIGGSIDRSSGWGGQVDALVGAPLVQDRVIAHAEATGQGDALDRVARRDRNGASAGGGLDQAESGLRNAGGEIGRLVELAPAGKQLPEIRVAGALGILPGFLRRTQRRRDIGIAAVGESRIGRKGDRDQGNAAKYGLGPDHLTEFNHSNYLVFYRPLHSYAEGDNPRTHGTSDA
jgi:hypothetical protein